MRHPNKFKRTEEYRSFIKEHYLKTKRIGQVVIHSKNVLGVNVSPKYVRDVLNELGVEIKHTPSKPSFYKAQL